MCCILIFRYAAGGLAHDPNSLPHIGAQAGAIPTGYPGSHPGSQQPMGGYLAGMPGTIPGQSHPPTQINEVPGAPVAPPQAQVSLLNVVLLNLYPNLFATFFTIFTRCRILNYIVCGIVIAWNKIQYLIQWSLHCKTFCCNLD